MGFSFFGRSGRDESYRIAAESVFFFSSQMPDCSCCDDLTMNKCNPCKYCRKNPCQKFGYLAKDKPVRCESIEPAVQCCPSCSSSESCCCPSSSSSSSSSSSCPCPSSSSSSSSSSSACCPLPSSSSSSSSSSCPPPSCSSSSSSSSCPKCHHACSSSSSSSSSSECLCCPESSSSSSSSSECEPKRCNYCPNNPCGDHSLSSILDSLDCSCLEHSSSSSSSGCGDTCDKSDKHHDKHHDKKDGKYHKSKQFLITFGEGKKHYWSEYSTCSDAIYVNGKVGPIIHLYRGYKYVFKVEQDIPPGARPEHYFVLTKCPDGGRNDIIPGGFEPIAQGCGYLCVNDRTPRFFFYHDTRHRYTGGLVLVHDHYPHEK